MAKAKVVAKGLTLSMEARIAKVPSFSLNVVSDGAVRDTVGLSSSSIVIVTAFLLPIVPLLPASVIV